MNIDLKEKDWKPLIKCSKCNFYLESLFETVFIPTQRRRTYKGCLKCGAKYYLEERNESHK